MIGIIFGWPSLQYVLQREGYFSYLCDETTGNHTLQNRTEKVCEESEESFNLVFTLSLFSLCIFAVFEGHLLDRFGTWIVRSFGTFLLTLGCILIAVSTPATSWLLYPAMIFMGISGSTFLISNMQVANLAGSQTRGLIITFLNGIFDSGAVVFLIIKSAYDFGYDLKHVFHVYAWCTLFTWLRTFALMPSQRIPFSVTTKNFFYGWKEWVCFKKRYDKTEDPDIFTTDDESAAANIQEVGTTFGDCLRKVLFWSNAFHLSTTSLRINFYFGSFITWIDSFESPSNSSHLTNVFGIMLLCGFIAAPLNGLLVDGVIKFSKIKSLPTRVGLLRAAFASMLMTSVLAILLSVSVITQSSYASFAFLVITRAFVYGGNTTFLAMHFPEQHFGKLYGLTTAIAGTASSLQYALFQLASSVDPTFYFINYSFLVVACLTLVHPLLLSLQEGIKLC
ncbi:unnamed protein product [Clavelina lepadiformis]|uniref:Solute carrier family 43 member 3 n=1 Tax=Clavelina lepadiformis TaxID=159417 RepID=A0ABP0GND6_CLALP